MSEAIEESTKHKKMTILCVDDERIILRTLQRLFRRKDYNVLTANSAEIALQIMEKSSVDLIVSDMRMPEMDGATLLSKVAISHPDTYRIVLSGYADFESTVAAINLGKIHRFVNKPWDNEGLVNAVEEGLHLIGLTKENLRLKSKVEHQNKLLKSANSSLEEKILLRTKQIKTTLNRNLRNNLESEKMLFNFIGINPNLSGTFAKKVAQLAVRLGKELHLDLESLHDLRLAGYLNEVGLLGLPPFYCQTPFKKLTYEQKSIFLEQSIITQQILAPAQRLVSVKEILMNQFNSLDKINMQLSGNTLLACKILIVARDYWRLSVGKIDERKLPRKEVLVELNKEKNIKYAENLLELLENKPELINDIEQEPGLKSLQLLPDMVLKESLFSSQNLLILLEGHIFTENSIDKLIEYETNQKQDFVIVIKS